MNRFKYKCKRALKTYNTYKAYIQLCAFHEHLEYSCGFFNDTNVKLFANEVLQWLFDNNYRHPNKRKLIRDAIKIHNRKHGTTVLINVITDQLDGLDQRENDHVKQK